MSTNPSPANWTKGRRKGALISAGLLLVLVIGVYALTLLVIRNGGAQ